MPLVQWISDFISRRGLEGPDAPANEQCLPALFRQKAQHRRLRGGKNDDGENVCSGSHNSWKIKQNIHLGHDSLTDALELVLRNPSSGELLNDDVTGYSIAVALREAVAAELGVQTEELGCDCHPIKVDGNPARAIRVFDLRSGGYTTQAAERLNAPGLWKRVINRLDSCDCSHACQRCLLSFDNRFEATRLDRHAAMAWINQSWLAGLALPTELAVFGPESQAEITNLQEAVVREITRDDSSKIVALYLTAPAEEWDLAVARRLRQQLQTWENAGHQVQVHMLESTVTSLPGDQKEWLTKIAFNGVQICLHNAIPDLGALALNITLQGPKGCVAWASDNTNLVVPGRTWDLADAGARIIRGTSSALQAERILNAADLMPAARPGLIKIEIGNQLDGSLDSFAHRLWDHLRIEANGLLDDTLRGNDPITELVYSDRYVCSPIVVNLLVGMIHELRQLSDAEFAIRIMGRQYLREDNRSPWQCRHDWLSARERDEALRQALEYCGLEGEVLSLPSLPHYRQLQLKLRSGRQLTIQFDQGLSYWEPERSDKSYQLRFNFASSEIGEEIMDRIRCRVSAVGDENTQIFISSS